MALYRTYRPSTFAEVVGQEHVTDPLSVALDSGRINHAYLFSGPRGCGKTSSARILARSLNCEQGPTSTPCGVCSSCVALAPGGPGNLDVVELDAASHGGVDDTRELRDRAFYAPAESRYRVFIVDEAHMVTTAGFNALLKIVEEPPEHLIFVFATTEPEKVLPTIRSRTHHYPFRLLAPTVMRSLLERITTAESVEVQDAVYPLVIRAGGGSPRDTLSILDQLLAGAEGGLVRYDRAVALLGVTDVALIDETIDALADGDGAGVFGAVQRVVDAGHDPRRFAVDLLDRLRDLILVRAVPDATGRGLVDVPNDVAERIVEQAARIGPATLARYAEVVHAGLGEMRGATAPRLLLEVLCARMLLPEAGTDQAALLQRVETVERALATGDRGSVSVGGGTSNAGAAVADSAEAPSSHPRAENESRRTFVRPSSRADAAEPTAAAAPRSETAAPPAAPRSETAVPPAPAEQEAAAEPESLVAQRRTASEGETPAESASAARPTHAAEPTQAARPTHAAEPTQAARPTHAAEPTDAAGATQAPQPTHAAEPESAAHSENPANSVAGPTRTTEAPRADEPIDTAAHPQPSPAASAAPAAPSGPTTDHEPAVAEQPVPETATPTAAPAAGPDIDAVRAKWQQVRDAVREHSRTVEVMLSGAAVQAVGDGRLVLTHESAPLAKRLVEPRNAEAIRRAFHDVFGVEVAVECVTGQSAPAPVRSQPERRQAQSRPAQRDRKEKPTYTRPKRDPAPEGAAAQPAPERRIAPPPGDDEPPIAEAPPSVDEEEEMMAEAARDRETGGSTSSSAQRRDPEDVALELLKSELGARRIGD